MNDNNFISILIISEDKKTREETAVTFCRERGVAPIDMFLFDKETFEKKDIKKPAASIGIEDVRQLFSKLYLKPLRSPIKAVIVKDAQLLTPEAQNALLKVLEEPPAQTMVLLTADTEDALLPTIRSRCLLIKNGEGKVLTHEEKNNYEQLIKLIETKSIPELLVLAENVAKDKDKVPLWLQSIIITTREKLLDAVQTDQPNREELLIRYVRLLIALQQTYVFVRSTNVNARFALEHAFLNY